MQPGAPPRSPTSTSSARTRPARWVPCRRQGLAIDDVKRPFLVDGTTFGSLLYLKGTVKCIVTARLSGSETDAVSAPIYIEQAGP